VLAIFDLPKFWRSPNEPSEADGVKEGFRSGGLDFVRGFRNGISGLIMTPWRRYEEAVSLNNNPSAHISGMARLGARHSAVLARLVHQSNGWNASLILATCQGYGIRCET